MGREEELVIAIIEVSMLLEEEQNYWKHEFEQDRTLHA